MAQKRPCSISDCFRKKENCVTDSSEIEAEMNVEVPKENTCLFFVPNKFFLSAVQCFAGSISSK